MTKTPEQMAIEWEQQEPECGLKRNGFLAGYHTAQQWISVKERLPEEEAHD